MDGVFAFLFVSGAIINLMNRHKDLRDAKEIESICGEELNIKRDLVWLYLFNISTILALLMLRI